MILKHPTTIRQIKPFPEGVFEVTVGNGEATTYTVSVAEEYCRKIAGSVVLPEELVRKSFEFLLAREPKESILRQFDLRDISRYFPEYESELSKNFLLKQ
jgi:hypothetical protein